MEFIQQRNDEDCTVACLAMYAEKTYEEIVDVMKLLKIETPLSSDKDIEILRHLGFDPVILHGWVWQTKGILTVPSLNFPGLLHTVCWTGNTKDGKVLDPQTGREGKNAYTSEQMLNGRTGWACYLGDLRDDTVRMFAEMELKELKESLERI